MRLPRLLISLVLCLWALCLWAADIVVVYPVDAVAPGERAYAKALAGHVRRWYGECGVETDLVADTAFRGGDGHRVAVLVDCYTPTPALLTQIRRGMDAGTRFVVCYSGSDALARLFGLRAVGYRADGPRRAMDFLPNRPKGAPARIVQTSANRFEVKPAKSGAAAPLAWWIDDAGRRAGVAWWRTPAGHCWMTHILTGDGDEDGKRRLLLAIAAEQIPGVWTAAANRVLDDAAKELPALRTRVRALPAGSPRRIAAQRALALVEAQQESARDALRRGGEAAYQAARDLRALMARAYAQTFIAPAGETVGVWDHFALGLWPGDWDRTARELAAAGVTDVYVNVAGAAFALYPSRTLPRKGTDDLLSEALAACHRHGLRLHAWILCFSCERAASPEAVADFRRRGWTLQDAAGKDLGWLDPTHPAVRARLLAAVKEIATRYDVDGIHLDFIRFPGLPQSLGPRTKTRFEAACGKAPNWPDCVSRPGGARRADFLRWRAGQIEAAVRDVRAWLRAEKPGVALSAAVYGKYPACVDSVGQDWLGWLRRGLLDAALPMNYTEDAAKLREWLTTQTADRALARRVVSGVGVTAAESTLTPFETLRQIDAAAKAGCRGFALFDLDETLRTEILPLLKARKAP